MTDGQLKSAVLEASHRPDVADALERLYASVQREINTRKPLCVISGKCCRFEEYGHRLYVTTLELACFMRGLDRKPDENWDGRGCPFQQNKLCSVHAIRPFGCRMFFCDPASTQWQNELYECFHAELKRLHEELNIPYAYVEWRQALSMLGLADVR